MGKIISINVLKKISKSCKIKQSEEVITIFKNMITGWDES